MRATQARRHGIILIGLTISALVAGSVGVASAQDGALRLWLEWPNEGETLYAGPTSLLYKVPIKGRVVSDEYEANQIQVRLEVFKGAAAIGRLTQLPEADGAFEFFVTVNPRGAVEEFPIAFVDCGRVCHSPGDLDLQPGHLRLQITATDPAGNTATLERSIVVDLSDYATVPVQAVLADDPDRVIEGVRVSASTRMYLWRARYGLGMTGSDGMAAVRVEALSQAPTRYVFRVDPTIVDGVLYRGIDSVEITLPPGAISAQPVMLQLAASKGQISGALSAATDVPFAALKVRAIHLPDGASHEAQPSGQGVYAFHDLPIGQYQIALDADTLAAHGCAAGNLIVDLAASPTTSFDLTLKPLTGRSLHGTVTDAQGAPLPFAWVTVVDGALTQGVSPESGAYALHGVADETRTIVTSAPGYYSRADAIAPDALETLDIALARRPDTKRLAWGDGEILIPPESEADVADGHIAFERGWLWGQGGESQPLIVETVAANIMIHRGHFAIEQSAGRTGWFYLFEGEAMITAADSDSVNMQRGAMLALVAGARLKPVPLDPNVLAALRPSGSVPISEVWESTVEARIRDGLAQVGIGAAQAITFIAYSLVILLLVVAPLVAVIWQVKRRAHS